MSKKSSKKTEHATRADKNKILIGDKFAFKKTMSSMFKHKGASKSFWPKISGSPPKLILLSGVNIF